MRDPSVVARIHPLAQVPELHSAIVAFLVCSKALIDLLTQLIGSEGVFDAKLDGFHRDGNVYGGRLLKCLEHNATRERREDAEALADLIRKNKAQWIDRLIRARDDLTHPEKGVQQVMFEMRIATKAGTPVLEEVLPPRVSDEPIDEYVAHTEWRLKAFSRSIVDRLRNSAGSPA